MKYRITPRAGRDLAAIGRYTVGKWGRKQRNAYILRLRKRIEWLSDNPNLGTHREEIRPGFMSYPEGEHYIFYLIYVDRIDIIGLPHRLMDIPAYFDVKR
jgi:toxin ParE1/3/4